MKVLKEGHWNDPWLIEVICSNTACEATLEVEERDVSSPYGGGYLVRCCVCRHTTSVPPERIHMRVRENTDAKRR